MTAAVIALKSALQHPLRLLTSVLSLRYFLLRASTAAAEIAAGLVQTFVFARVLTPERFSIFILIGTLGVSLWLFDLGAAKILFVRQRARHLGQRADLTVASHSSAVVLLYGLIVLSGAVLCFAVTAGGASVTPWQATEYAGFRKLGWGGCTGRPFCWEASNMAERRRRAAVVVTLRFEIVAEIRVEPNAKFRVCRSLVESGYDGIDWEPRRP